MSESVLHFGGVRLLLLGTGNLQVGFLNLNDPTVTSFTAIPMTETITQEKTRIVNYKSQRAMVKFSTTAINERFQISRVIVFAKEIYPTLPTVD